MKDRNFDDIAEKLSRNIYGTTKGEIRQAVLWRDLEELMASMPDRPLRVLDAGGGEGMMACEMARRGHDVIFCDISETMLERARQSAVEKGVADKIKFIHCAAQDAVDRLDAPVDLVLFHAVLEWIDDQRSALLRVAECLRPGGVLSLMFYNYDALLFRNVTLGNFGYIASGMRKKRESRCLPTGRLRRSRLINGWGKWGCLLLKKAAFGYSMTICRINSNSSRSLLHCWRWSYAIAGRSRL